MAKQRLKGVRIRQFKGLEALDVDLTKGDATTATGENRQGKTSFVDALRVGLTGQLRAGLKQRGVGPEVIRQGADRAEIFVDIDELTVRRVIGPNKTTVSVMKAGGTTKDDVLASKQQFLTDLVGAGPIDPLDLYLAPPKDRRAKILEALPLSVTLDQLRTYASDLPDTFDVSGHGLEVLDRTRQHYYDARTETNRAVKDAKKAKDEADKAAAAALAEEVVDVTGAQAAVQTAKDEASALTVRAGEARAAEERSASTRARIEELRQKALAMEATFQLPSSFDDELAAAAGRLREAEAAAAAASARCVELEQALANARTDARTAAQGRDAAQDALAIVRSGADASTAAQRDVETLRKQASDLELAIGAAVSPPSDEERVAAETRIAEATERLAAARTKAEQVAAGVAARAKSASAAKALADLEATAASYDAVVKALDKAPGELFATADMIRGLTLEGDEVLLDGKRMDHLCGEEQLDLAIEIAKRATKCRFLIVDGLERIAPSRIETFVNRATAGGWQLIATRVADGELTFDHWTHDEDDVEARAESEEAAE